MRLEQLGSAAGSLATQILRPNALTTISFLVSTRLHVIIRAYQSENIMDIELPSINQAYI